MRLVAAVALLACAACSRAAEREAVPDTRPRDNVHDLIALAPLADVTDVGKHPPHPDASVDWRDHRDGLSLLRCPAGQSITFPPLTVHGAAHLAAGCGSSAPLGTVSDGRSVRFLVEAARVPDRADAAGAGAAGALEFHELAARTLELLSVEVGGPTPLEADLPAAPVSAATPAGVPTGAAAGSGSAATPEAPTTWVLRFSTQRWITDDGPPRAGSPEERVVLDWPAWIAPVLTSAGRRVPLAADPVEVSGTAQDLVADFGSAAVLVQDEAQPVVRGNLEPAEDSGTTGGHRAAIEAPAPSRVRFLITPQRGDRLQWSFGVDSLRGWALGGDGMRFAIEAGGERVWEQLLQPATIRSDRGWHEASLDLSRFAGHELVLDLLTDAGPEQHGAHDVGGWASVRVVREQSVPRLPQHAAPTIVLLVVDTLRADRLGSSGHGSRLTPRFDTLAARGTTFRAARSTASWTWPATASILTGLSPAEHGVHDARHCLLGEDIDTLAELCQRKGYTTAAFTANLLISRGNRFDQGFETFVLMPGVTARALNEHVGHWLAQTDGLARLLYVHYIDPHAPYAPPDGWLTAPGVPDLAVREDAAALDAELARHAAAHEDPPPGFVDRFVDAAAARYDGEVAYVDTAIGELVDALAAHGALDDALLVVTADHGEEFLEHGNIGHGPSLYEESLRVPLLVVPFGKLADAAFAAGGPAVELQPVSTRDIVPTLVALAGLPAPSRALPGHPLLAWPGGTARLPRDDANGPTRPASAAAFFSETRLGREPGVATTVEKLALYDGRWKLVSTAATGRVELYDLLTDPSERNDVAAQEPARSDGMLAALRAGYPGGGEADGGVGTQASEDAIERMAALGYLGR